MNFDPLTQDGVGELLSNFAKDDRQRLGVVLTDGSMMSGFLHRPFGRHEDDEEVGAEDALSLSVELKEIRIPFGQISGLFPVDFRQPSEAFYPIIVWSEDAETTSPPETTRSRSESIWSALDSAALRCAEEHDFEVSTWATVSAISAGFSRYGRWKAPRDFQPLYCDWEYFSRRAGGLRGIGGGFVVSGSVSVQPSLFRDVYREIAGRVRDRSTVCEETNVVVDGFVLPLSSVTMAGAERSSLTMEDMPWQAMAVRGGSLSGEQLDISGSWAIAYFATRGLSIPLEIWPDSGQPIRVYGEVIRVDAETDLGVARCFIKARAAACLGSK